MRDFFEVLPLKGVFTKGGDLCLSDKGILLETCEIGEQGDLSALVYRRA